MSEDDTRGDHHFEQNYCLKTDTDYMSRQMLEYFKNKLLKWQQQLLHECGDIQLSIQNETSREPDEVDQGIIEESRETQLSLLARNRKLISAIEHALARIIDGSYGYCEETGEPIGALRLDAWPVACYTVEAQQKREQENSKHR
jgi:DnaK suppressor protein